MELENISIMHFSFDWIFSRWYCLTQFELREIPINIIRIFFTYVWKITLCSNRNLLQTLCSFALKKTWTFLLLCSLKSLLTSYVTSSHRKGKYLVLIPKFPITFIFVPKICSFSPNFLFCLDVYSLRHRQSIIL